MFQQRRRKRAVPAIAIGGGRSLLGGKRDERIRLARLDAD
jgi:hypothetical protein